MRSLTAPAVVAWAARMGSLDLSGTLFAFMGSLPAVAIFSLLAIIELVTDVLPTTPKRTSPVPLIARILMGAFSAACLCVSANRWSVIAIVLGAVGAIIGAFVGYQIRKRLVQGLRVKDIFIAIPEDLIAIGLACFLVSR